MPRLKEDKEEQERKLLAGTIKKYMNVKDVNPIKLGKAIGISPASMYNRLKNPNTFRLGELKATYIYLQVPEEERIRL